MPEANLGGRPAAYPKCEILNGIFYLVRSGCSWRMLPQDLPPWVKGRKRHLLVDTLGLMLTVVVTADITVFVVRLSRGAIVAHGLLGEGFWGWLGTDRWSA